VAAGRLPLPRLERPFSDGLLAIFVSDAADAFPFRAFADALVAACDGEIVQEVGPFGGVDEVYWDLRLHGRLVTLHRQHFLGVFLCARDRDSERLLEDLLPFTASYLAAHVPPADGE
jgi:hypothetical protein